MSSESQELTQTIQIENQSQMSKSTVKSGAKADSTDPNEVQFVINPTEDEKVWKPKFDKFFKGQAENYMFQLIDDKISEEEMRIEFSKKILNAVFGSKDFKPKDPSQYIRTVEKNLREICSFLKIIYPRNKKTEVAAELVDGIKECNFTDRVENDLMAIHKTLFDYTTDVKEKDIKVLDQIKAFLNLMIEQQKLAYPEFKDVLKNKLIEYIIPDARESIKEAMNDGYKFKMGTKLPEDHPRLSDFGSEKMKLPSTQIFRILVKWIEDLSELIQKTEEAMIKRKYLKKFYLQGKGNDSKSTNSEDTVNTVKSDVSEGEKGFFETLASKFKNLCGSHHEEADFENKSYFLERKGKKKISFESFRFNIPGSPINEMLMEMAPLKPELSTEFVKQQLEVLLQKYIEIISVIEKNEQIGKLTLEEKKTYGFSSYTFEFLEEMVVDRLVDLVKNFVDFRNHEQNNLNKKQMFEDIDLVSFRLFDLVRARIMVNQKQIFDVFQGLQQMHVGGEIEIIKVKNRFSQALNDAIVVFKLKKSQMLCEFQLILFKEKGEAERKEKAFEILNHYFYELERATYGPLSELALIIATKDHRVQTLKFIGRKRPSKINAFKDVCTCKQGVMSADVSARYYDYESIEIYRYNRKDHLFDIDTTAWRATLPKSFICSACQKVYGKGENPFGIQICQKCNYQLCSECQFLADSSSMEARYMRLLEIVCNVPFRESYGDSEEDNGEVIDEYDEDDYVETRIAYLSDAEKHEFDEADSSYYISLLTRVVFLTSEMSDNKFWTRVRSEFENTSRLIKKGETFDCYGILLHVSEVFTLSNVPFKLFKYNYHEKKIEQLSLEKEKVECEEADTKSIQLRPFDAFFFVERPTDNNEDQSKAKETMKILRNWTKLLLKENLFYRRKPRVDNLLDDSIKIKKSLAKLTSVYDNEVHMPSQDLKKFKIPGDFSSKIKSIKFLNLNNNSIKTIEPIYQLRNLEDLRIERNEIKTLNINGEFRHLQNLYCGSNYIEDLRVVGHDDLKILEGLDNQYNYIEVRKLKSLNELELSNTDSDQKVRGFINKVDKLSYMKLQNLNFTGDNSFEIDDYEDLDELIVSYCNLKVKSLETELDYVTIEGNTHPIAISKNAELKYIVLQDCHFSKVEVPSIAQKFDVEPSYESDFEFSLYPQMYSNLRHLRINTSDEKHKTEFNGIFSSIDCRLPQLESLQIENYADAVNLEPEATFDSFPKLRKITGYNFIKGIESLPLPIQELSIEFSEMTEFNFDPDNIENVGELNKMQFTNCRFPEVIVPKSCKSIEVYYCELKRLAIGNVNSLEEIRVGDLEGFSMACIENSKLSSLRVLELEGMDIRKLTFKNKLSQLTELRLARNQIADMDWMPKENFDSLVNLDLSDNQMRKFKLVDFPELKYLYLDSNPWDNIEEDVANFSQKAQHLPNLTETLATLSLFPICIKGEYLDQDQIPDSLRKKFKDVAEEFEYINEIK